MACSNLNTPLTANNATTSSTLELDFPWLMASPSLPTLDFSTDIPAAAVNGPASPVTYQIPQLDLPAFWSPISFHDTASSKTPPKSIPSLQLGFSDSSTSTPPPQHAGLSSRTSSPVGSSGDSSGYSSLLSSTPSSSGSSSDVSSSGSPTPVTAATTARQLEQPKVTKSNSLKKPSASYIEMIARALLSTVNTKMILSEIYVYIQEKYPYYKNAPDGNWRNAVRHNLCVNDCFIKSGRSNSGRGYFWTIHPACLEMFSRGDFSRMRARRLAQKMYKTLNKASSAERTKVSSAHIQNAAPTSYPAQAPSYPVTSAVPTSSSYLQPTPCYMRSVPVAPVASMAPMSGYSLGMTSSTNASQALPGYYYPTSYSASGHHLATPYANAHAYQHTSHAYQNASHAYQTSSRAYPNASHALQSASQPDFSAYRYHQYQQNQAINHYYPQQTSAASQQVPSYHGYPGYGMPTYL